MWTIDSEILLITATASGVPIVPPDVSAFFSIAWGPVPVLPSLGIALAITYLGGAIRLWSTGRRWPIPRTLVFLFGCTVLVGVTATEAEGYGQVLFSVFMFQQLTLMLVVPPLLVLGSPGTLLLRATPHRGAGRWLLRGALTALRSSLARAVIHPALTIPLFLLTFYGLYLTGLADVALSVAGGHLALELLFLVSGVLFATPILSRDALPRRHSSLGRLLEMAAKTALHTAFGIILMLSPAPLVDAFTRAPASWDVDPLYDQAIAGALVWTYAELPSFVILVYLLNRWYHDSTRRDRAADRKADSEGDPDLTAYNDYLNNLNRGSTPSTNGD